MRVFLTGLVLLTLIAFADPFYPSAWNLMDQYGGGFSPVTFFYSLIINTAKAFFGDVLYLLPLLLMFTDKRRDITYKSLIFIYYPFVLCASSISLALIMNEPNYENTQIFGGLGYSGAMMITQDFFRFLIPIIFIIAIFVMTYRLTKFNDSSLIVLGALIGMSIRTSKRVHVPGVIRKSNMKGLSGKLPSWAKIQPGRKKSTLPSAEISAAAATATQMTPTSDSEPPVDDLPVTGESTIDPKTEELLNELESVDLDRADDENEDKEKNGINPDESIENEADGFEMEEIEMSSDNIPKGSSNDDGENELSSEAPSDKAYEPEADSSDLPESDSSKTEEKKKSIKNTFSSFINKKSNYHFQEKAADNPHEEEKQDSGPDYSYKDFYFPHSKSQTIKESLEKIDDEEIREFIRLMETNEDDAIMDDLIDDDNKS